MKTPPVTILVFPILVLMIPFPVLITSFGFDDFKFRRFFFDSDDPITVTRILFLLLIFPGSSSSQSFTILPEILHFLNVHIEQCGNGPEKSDPAPGPVMIPQTLPGKKETVFDSIYAFPETVSFI